MRFALRAFLFLSVVLAACNRSTPTGPTSSLNRAEQPNVPVAPPSITSFAAIPGSIAPGQSVLLQWTVVDAASVTIDNGVGDVAPTGGSLFVTPPALPGTYELTATNSGGSVSKAVTIERQRPVFWALFAVPDKVLPNQTAILYWYADAESVTIDNGVGSWRGRGGSVVVAPSTYPATYQVTATNSAGSVSSTVTIELRPDPPDVEYRMFNYSDPGCGGWTRFWELTHDGFTENHNHPLFSFYTSIPHAVPGQELSLSAYCEPSSLGVSAMCVKTQIWKRGVLYVEGGNTCSAKGVF